METAAPRAATPLLCQGEMKKLLTCGEYSTGATRENVTIRLPLNSLPIADPWSAVPRHRFGTHRLSLKAGL